MRENTTHLKNKAIFNKIIQQELTTLTYLTPEQQAEHLNKKVDQLIAKSIKEGFKTPIYHNLVKPSYQKFTFITLWEGKQAQIPIPVSFFIYAWPAESWAKKHNLCAKEYASAIHDHPLPCAFVVLDGSVNQEIFIALEKKPYHRAKKIKEETLYPGQMVVDDQSQTFIHRVICRDLQKKSALTLHGYGASSQFEIEKIFSETYLEHVYWPVLQNESEF